MYLRDVAITATLMLVGTGSAGAQQVASDGTAQAVGATMTQGAPVWQRWPYGDSPKRELAISLAFCDPGEYDGGRSAGLTYTRNLAEYAALEAIVDVGVSRRSVYDASLNDYRLGSAHPFGLVIAQVRMGREPMPGLKQYVTLGLARAFGRHDPIASGRAGSVGIGLRGAVGSAVAIRVDLQALFFHAALGARASAGVVIGLD